MLKSIPTTIYQHAKDKEIILTLSPQYGNSALILAARRGHSDTVMELVKAGTKLDLQNEVKLYSNSTCSDNNWFPADRLRLSDTVTGQNIER